MLNITKSNTSLIKVGNETKPIPTLNYANETVVFLFQWTNICPDKDWSGRACTHLVMSLTLFVAR